jgi:membrane protein YqaA with SNARE-associated domain
METNEKKSTFFLRNLAKGLLWLGFVVALFVLAKYNVNKDVIHRFEPFYDKTGLILFIYTLSELIIGIIPPEVFIIWALETGDTHHYVIFVIILTCISYLAGFTAFLFGRYLNTTRVYRYLQRRFLKKSEKLLHDYGLYLILVASLTPFPFSGVAMLVGAVGYPLKDYMFLSLARFAKFAISAYVIWQANMI